MGTLRLASPFGLLITVATDTGAGALVVRLRVISADTIAMLVGVGIFTAVLDALVLSVIPFGLRRA